MKGFAPMGDDHYFPATTLNVLKRAGQQMYSSACSSYFLKIALLPLKRLTTSKYRHFRKNVVFLFWANLAHVFLPPLPLKNLVKNY
jgi:hypothetical protein